MLPTLTQNKPSDYGSDGQKAVTPGLPNNWREQLLQQQRTSYRRGTVKHVSCGDVALLLDILLAAGIELDGREMRLDDVQRAAAAYGCNPALIRRALDDSMFTIVGTVAGVRGRPKFIFRLPTRAELAQRLGAPIDVTDPLLPADLRTVTTYRQGLYRETIRRANAKRDGAPASFSRKLLAERLGVSKKTTRNYDKALGVVVEERIKETPLTHEDVMQLPRSRPKGSTERRQWIQVRDYYGTPVCRLPALRSLAIRELETLPGCRLELCEQLTSSYWLPTDVKAAAPKHHRRWNKKALNWLLECG